jgi:hypothetical protein
VPHRVHEKRKHTNPTRIPSSTSVGETLSPNPTTYLACCFTLMTYLSPSGVPPPAPSWGLRPPKTFGRADAAPPAELAMADWEGSAGWYRGEKVSRGFGVTQRRNHALALMIFEHRATRRVCSP